jgi:hypothetical protein
MTEQLKFEKDKHYRKRSGDKRLCIWVFGDGSALLVDETQDIYEYRSPTGRVSLTREMPNDIVGEWREPRQWTFYFVEHGDGGVCGTLYPGARKVLARVTVTEGEGL